MQPYILCPAVGSDQADEWHRLGLESQIAMNLPVAQHRYQQALRLDPRHALAAQNLAIVYAQSDHLNEALLTIERAEMFDGVHGIIPMNRALLLLEAERIDEALAAAKKAMQITPNVPSKVTLARVLTVAGMPDESMKLYNEVLDEEPTHPAAGPNSCFIQTLTNATPADLLKQRKRWYDANRYKGKLAPHTNDKNPDRPIRVGYVGGDFKSHSAAFIFSGVLWHHTPAIEMYLYSTIAVDRENDGKSKRFMDTAGWSATSDQGSLTLDSGPSGQPAVSRWRDITAIDDDGAEKMVRQDKIDILVDLAGHTNGGRLSLFTRKPAPIQVTAWGFAHGTGLPEIDYFLADPICVPESERKDYSEKILDLPCIVTMEPPEEYGLKASSTAPIKKNGYITFGTYARFEKMSDTCIKTFAEILRRVPDAKLEFKDAAYRRPYSIRRVMSLMPDIAPERLLFSIQTAHSDHMLAYQQADICLDPFPHGGGVVSMEQLYMGVPLVTMYGTQPSGRTGSSVLTAMGRTDWIAKTPEEYIDIAVRLADDPKTAKHRLTLRDELLKSPVIVGYVAKVEELYRQMWKGLASQ